MKTNDEYQREMFDEAQLRIRKMTDALLEWYQEYARALPWRESRDPYRVWVSEIMLQQTRVEAVKPYFARFMDRLPTIRDLAEVSEDELLKLWEGLGYYSRARNLQKAAQMICVQHGGVFPQAYEDIRALPGIGDYTAGAVASICFEQPTPAVDGNVLRVLTRITGDASDIASQAYKKYAAAVLADCYPPGRCGMFTQSLMELGATVCVPNGAPLCENCPVKAHCKAYEDGLQEVLPVKTPKKARRIEEKTVFLLFCDGKAAVRKRTAQGLLHGLWEFPNTEGHLSEQDVSGWLAVQEIEPQVVERMTDAKHIFTHVEWHMCGYAVQCKVQTDAYVWASVEALREEIALPSAFAKYTEIAKRELCE